MISFIHFHRTSKPPVQEIILWFNIMRFIRKGDYQSKQKIKTDLNLRGNLGPVVQSVVSLMSSLRVILLTVLADSIYNILIFFAENM